jgi:uncharacterized protein (TIGR03000 family)
MNRLALSHTGFLTALVAAVFSAGSVQAQGTNPNGTQYPYWDTAPQSFSGSRITIPVPGINPNMLSNAARSGAMAPGTSGIGGGYAPPRITSLDLRLPRRPNTDDDTKAHIWLRLPENADVWVNGVKTKQTGESRYFYSPPLVPGKKYSYDMRVRWMEDGKPVEKTQRVLVQAGETIRRDFTSQNSAEPRR